MKKVDDLENRQVEALASRWWDPNSEFKPLHDINPLRVNYISQHINLAEKRVLDIGCGGGILAEALAHHGATVTAIDKAEASLSVAKLHLLESQLDISYLNAAHPGDHLVATAEVVRRGRNLAHIEGRLVTEEGKLVATAKGTWAIWEKRPKSRGG